MIIPSIFWKESDIFSSLCMGVPHSSYYPAVYTTEQRPCVTRIATEHTEILNLLLRFLNNSIGRMITSLHTRILLHSNVSANSHKFKAPNKQILWKGMSYNLRHSLDLITTEMH